MEADIFARVRKGQQIQLTDDERQILSLDETFPQRFQNAMKPIIDQENADRLGISVDRYHQMAADIHNGMDPKGAYSKQQLGQARDHGFMNAEDYFVRLGGRAREKDLAKRYIQAEQTAKQAGCNLTGI